MKGNTRLQIVPSESVARFSVYMTNSIEQKLHETIAGDLNHTMTAELRLSAVTANLRNFRFMFLFSMHIMRVILDYADEKIIVLACDFRMSTDWTAM